MVVTGYNRKKKIVFLPHTLNMRDFPFTIEKREREGKKRKLENCVLALTHY